jgi:hypothetical protein
MYICASPAWARAKKHMPRNVRNFWIDSSIDGRDSRLSGGPRSKTGGFSLTVYQRANGCVSRTLIIDGFANDNGELTLSVRNRDDRQNFRVVTQR